MSSGDADWAELASQNERVIQLGDQAIDPAEMAPDAARAQWAELASQSERLADTSDPLFGLASSSHAGSGMRPVAGAA
jgi:hypothetical protein